ncbi:hypothetical protein HDV00_011475 [Rhizophlyctis rosea]|nr:hypothetical protein HDV00_011475 [Rhizophlyctis rosea]
MSLSKSEQDQKENEPEKCEPRFTLNDMWQAHQLEPRHTRGEFEYAVLSGSFLTVKKTKTTSVSRGAVVSLIVRMENATHEQPKRTYYVGDRAKWFRSHRAQRYVYIVYYNHYILAREPNIHHQQSVAQTITAWEDEVQQRTEDVVASYTNEVISGLTWYSHESEADRPTKPQAGDLFSNARLSIVDNNRTQTDISVLRSFDPKNGETIIGFELREPNLQFFGFEQSTIQSTAHVHYTASKARRADNRIIGSIEVLLGTRDAIELVPWNKGRPVRDDVRAPLIKVGKNAKGNLYLAMNHRCKQFGTIAENETVAHFFVIRADRTPCALRHENPAYLLAHRAAPEGTPSDSPADIERPPKHVSFDVNEDGRINDADNMEVDLELQKAIHNSLNEAETETGDETANTLTNLPLVSKSSVQEPSLLTAHNPPTMDDDDDEDNLSGTPPVTDVLGVLTELDKEIADIRRQIKVCRDEGRGKGGETSELKRLEEHLSVLYGLRMKLEVAAGAVKAVLDSRG